MLANGSRDAVRQERGDHMRDVTGLGKSDVSLMPTNLDIEQIRDRALVLDVPSRREGISKCCVQGACGVVVVEDEQVIDVTADDETLAGLLTVEREDTRIRRTLRKAVLKKPREERTLPAPACLCHTVYGLLYAADSGAAVRTQGGVPWRRVGGDKIPAAHSHAVARSDGGESTQRRGAHRSTERLVVIDAVSLGAALYTKARFHGAATLPFVNPNESHKRPVMRKLRAVDERPAAVGSVVGDLGALSRRPTGGIIGHGLLARARIGRYG
eukprot:6213049-Pleurochrysis_carterae.AAC.3